MEYQEGDEAVEINYRCKVRIVGRHPNFPEFYLITGVGWELLKGDEVTRASDLIPTKVMAKNICGDNREVW